ncbi:MAG TPA: tetratricopeptide repeat protein [Ktedonobacteraceae bacterium]
MIPSTLFCDTCGAANQGQATYCRFCGHTLHGIQPASYHSATGRLLAGVMLRQRFRILAPLGTGGMGAVYQAEDTQLGNRQIAIKEMSQSSLSPQEQKEAADAFRQEAVMLARLQHPNLPSIFDHFEENGRWYLVMSFIEGETLEEYLHRSLSGKLPVYEVVQIGITLCTVLGYLHNQQPAIIFRDLKLANIMRTPEEHLYLIDFGIARHFKPGQAKDTAYYGSMGYAPPEQYGKAQTTPRSDIYSLGAILHQLLSGHDPADTPFRFPTLSTLVPTVPAHLAELVSQMLDIDEEKRPASVLQVKQELQTLLSPPHSTSALRAVTPHSASSLRPIIPRPTTPEIGALPSIQPKRTKEQWLETGTIYFKAKHYRDALAAYDHAIHLDANFADAYKYKSFALYKLSRYKEVLATCEQALRLNPGDITLYKCKADTLESLGKSEEAINAYDQAIHLDPTDVYSYYRKADILEMLGQREEALLVLERTIRLAPGDVRGYYGKADVLEALGRREEALLLLEQAIYLAPNEIRGYRSKAILLEALDHTKEALSTREQIIHLDPNDAYNHYFKGALLEKLNRPEEALDAYDEAIRLNTNDDFLYQRKASVLSKLNRYGEALRAYDEAIRIKPDAASAHRGKGDVLQQLGRLTEAAQAHAQAKQCEAM